MRSNVFWLHYVPDGMASVNNSPPVGVCVCACVSMLRAGMSVCCNMIIQAWLITYIYGTCSDQTGMCSFQ